jgi:hypothetical protein
MINGMIRHATFATICASLGAAMGAAPAEAERILLMFVSR